METYFILAQGEDTPSISGPLSKEEALKRIEEKYYGDLPILNELPYFGDGYFDKKGLILIKGSIVVPKPVQVITKFDL